MPFPEADMLLYLMPDWPLIFVFATLLVMGGLGIVGIARETRPGPPRAKLHLRGRPALACGPRRGPGVPEKSACRDGAGLGAAQRGKRRRLL